MTSIQRKILFYTVEGKGSAGDGTKANVDLAAALAHIATLPADAPDAGAPSRYLTWAAGDELLLEVVKTTPKRISGVFAQKQYAGIGRIERRGKYRDLVLAAGEGLAHLRHFVFWPDRGLLGIEINGRGPGMTALQKYLIDKCKESQDLHEVDFVVLLAPDAFDALQRAERISSATIGVRRENISAVSKISGHAEKAFKAANEATNANELRIEFKLGDRRQDASLELGFLDKARKALSDPLTRKSLTSLQATVKDPDWGTTRTIDLLEERFVAVAHDVKTVNGVVDADAMFKAIVKAEKGVEIE